MIRPNRLAVDVDALLRRLDALVAVNPLPPAGACRLALSQEDREGRDLFRRWATDAGLAVAVDAVGNIFATLAGARADLPPVMSGSHLDTVATGGRLDGALGVIAALGVAEAMARAGSRPPRGLVVAAFTGEEGARFQPDMLGSLVWAGGMSVEEARAICGVDGALFGEALDGIGYAGDLAPADVRPHAFVELHVEQGPILDAEGVAIGVVEGVQGISWREVTFTGEANHAGATPMAMRHDAGFAAGALAAALRAMTGEIEGLLATCGRIGLSPDVINVVPERAVATVDLRHPDEASLAAAEAALEARIAAIAEAASVVATSRTLARFAPVAFDAGLVAMVEEAAADRGLTRRRLVSGAGHDAQMAQRVCPSAMIFAPSIGGISHNPAEATRDEDVASAVEVLADVLDRLCHEV